MNTRLWRWIPSLYFGQGLPFVAVNTLSVVLYKHLNVSNTEIALFTSGFYLPWVLKPLWSPIVELFGTQRRWIVTMQFVVGVALLALAWAMPLSNVLRATLAIFWLIAIASATHDIAADGFYLKALVPGERAAFVGIRSLAFRLSMIAGQGGIVWLAGTLIDQAQTPASAWATIFTALGALFVLLALYHRWALPRPASDAPIAHREGVFREFIATFVSFFRRRDIAIALAFLLTFRLGEAQALKLLAPFFLDSRASGGLGLSTAQLGWIYGTLGVVALTLGGILGGLAISQRGLRAWLWPMLLAVHIPNLAFVFLAWVQPTNVVLIAITVCLEQFGYGFGFSAYLLYMMWVAEGPHQTAHYAICTGFMALGMMLPGMASGWIQSQLGYRGFFIWVCIATIPSMLVALKIALEENYGKK